MNEFLIMPISLNFINCILIFLYLLVAVPLWKGYLYPKPEIPKGFLRQQVASLRQKTLEKAKIRRMNLLMPADYKELLAFNGSPVGRDPDALMSYQLYYQDLSDVLPPPLSADAYAMLAFCYFHQHKISDALNYYEKSLAVNPAFVWTYYNLAVIHFRAGDYDKVLELSSRFIGLAPEYTFRIIASSKVYTDILGGGPGLDFSEEIKKTYSDFFRMLVISQYRLTKFSELVSTARYAIGSGFGPVEVFGFYASLASGSDDDRGKAEAFFQNAPGEEKSIYSGQDIFPRFF